MSAESWNEEQRTGVFNQVMSLSTMRGIQYFSSSRNAMRLLYDYSNFIDGPETRNPLPDPVFASPPEELALYARQRDLTFGDNVFRHHYVTTMDAVFFMQENITALTLGIIPVIGRGNLRTVMAIIDCGDSILTYAISMAKAFSVSAIWNRVSSSFSSRVEAVIDWFAGRLDNELFIQ